MTLPKPISYLLRPISYHTYIIECADGTLYTGITTDLERRIREHNESSKGAKYTKMRRPVRLVYSEVFENRSEASKREYAIKQLSREEKLRLIDGLLAEPKASRSSEQEIEESAGH